MIFRSFITDFLPICNGVSSIQKMLERKLEIKATGHEPRIWGLNKLIARKVWLFWGYSCLFFFFPVKWTVYFFFTLSQLLGYIFFLSAFFPFQLEVFQHCYYSSFRSTALFVLEEVKSLLSGAIAGDISEPSAKTKGSRSQCMGF